MKKLTIRLAKWVDKTTLRDIDLKCFEDPWDESYWVYWFDVTRVVLMVEQDKVPIGFMAGGLSEDGLVVEKIAVKKLYRLQGASRLLLDACDDLTIQCPQKAHIHIVVPEPWLYPCDECIADWIRAVGFKARLPYMPKYFHFNGEDIDGVRCERNV